MGKRETVRDTSSTRPSCCSVVKGKMMLSVAIPFISLCLATSIVCRSSLL